MKLQVTPELLNCGDVVAPAAAADGGDVAAPAAAADGGDVAAPAAAADGGGCYEIRGRNGSGFWCSVRQNAGNLNKSECEDV